MSLFFLCSRQTALGFCLPSLLYRCFCHSGDNLFQPKRVTRKAIRADKELVYELNISLLGHSSYFTVACREGSLVEHGETGGAVPGGAVFSDPAHMLGFITGVDPPGLEEEHHVHDLFNHSAIGKL